MHSTAISEKLFDIDSLLRKSLYPLVLLLCHCRAAILIFSISCIRARSKFFCDFLSCIILPFKWLYYRTAQIYRAVFRLNVSKHNYRTFQICHAPGRMKFSKRSVDLHSSRKYHLPIIVLLQNTPSRIPQNIPSRIMAIFVLAKHNRAGTL